MNDRSSQEATTDPPIETALLDAVERLCETRAPSTVSIRMIAAEAGLSVGVAYNYFASRDELLGAALDRMARRMAASGTGTDDPRDALLALLDTMRTNAAFPRLVTGLVLEGRNVSDVMSGHPLIQQVAASARERGAVDPVGTALAMALMAIGTHTFDGPLNIAAGRDPDDARLRELAADMYAHWFPGPTT